MHFFEFDCRLGFSLKMAICLFLKNLYLSVKQRITNIDIFLSINQING